MHTPADPDLARRLRIARLLMVTACDWGLATTTERARAAPVAPSEGRSTPPRIRLRDTARAWPAHARNPACASASTPQGQLRLTSLSGIAI